MNQINLTARGAEGKGGGVVFRGLHFHKVASIWIYMCTFSCLHLLLVPAIALWFYLSIIFSLNGLLHTSSWREEKIIFVYQTCLLIFDYLTQFSQRSTWKLWCNFEHQRETSWILSRHYGNTEFTAEADPWNQYRWGCWWPANQFSWSCCLPGVCNERSVHWFSQVEVHWT